MLRGLCLMNLELWKKEEDAVACVEDVNSSIINLRCCIMRSFDLSYFHLFIFQGICLTLSVLQRRIVSYIRGSFNKKNAEERVWLNFKGIDDKANSSSHWTISV
jgi:hypothetical protein